MQDLILRAPRTPAQRQAARRRRLADAGFSTVKIVVPTAVHMTLRSLARRHGQPASVVVERALLALSSEDAS